VPASRTEPARTQAANDAAVERLATAQPRLVDVAHIGIAGSHGGQIGAGLARAPRQPLADASAALRRIG
jgi:hypothetical protein